MVKVFKTFFAGITGIDLRGLTREDVLAVLAKIAATVEESEKSLEITTRSTRSFQ